MRYIFDPRMGPFARIRRREIFVEYMNTNRAAAEKEVQNGVDQNGNCPDLSTKQQHFNGVHLKTENGVEGKLNGTSFRSRKGQSKNKLSVKESDNELIKAHYIFYK